MGTEAFGLHPSHPLCYAMLNLMKYYMDIHSESKRRKEYTILVSISSANIDLFKNFLTATLSRKFAIKTSPENLKLGMLELCAKILQIMRNDFKDYARTFCQLCAHYAHLVRVCITHNWHSTIKRTF